MLDVAAPAYALSPIDHENNPKFKELFRLKIWNATEGTIEASADNGKNWQTLGKVLLPTTQINANSYAAARYVGDGKVAATSVNAIHLKVSAEATTGNGVIFSLLPKEFRALPKDYKSYFSPDASIYTDIPAGTGIFGGGFAPYVGNVIMLSRPGYAIVPWPSGYPPQVNDKIYILVDRPADYPKEIVFENRAGGDVTIKYFNDSQKVIGRVVKPVTGVGRFEGGKYTSAGRIRANHAGVIDVSTSPLGWIGGFQIVPAAHAAALKYPLAQNQWLVVGPIEDSPSLEGTAPLFKYFIKPQYREDDILAENWEEQLLGRFLVDVKLKGADKWQPLPVYEFDKYFLTGGIPAELNNALADVTEIRILFPISGQ
ncbi:MAG TPA: hypothetical protein VMT55_01505 [Candidatus Sulfotelmatobacter sp.]|nr:hypothetical protein [Candidatus Sulfotelmatobacter sp.]